ncbi:MAG: DUF4181 domain-containing protein [Bacillota bacterium]|nr:DUF4181 domain-containing protein [Bacillota bacterium]
MFSHIYFILRMVDPIIWIKLFLFIGILLLLSSIFSSLMRKFLKVEKKKVFSNKPLNEKHKKIDRIIRTSFIIILLITQIFIIARVIKEPAWYLKSPFLIITFSVASGIVRAFMEWKYAENRKEYIFTISQLIFILIMLLILLSTNFFNFFNY